MRTLQEPPERGSFADMIASSYLARQKNIELAKHKYVGRILASGLGIPGPVLDIQTRLLELDMDICPSYELKKAYYEQISEMFNANSQRNQSYFKRLKNLTITEKTFRAATAEELEERKRRVAERRRQRSPLN